MNASPFGSHETTLASSFRSISINFRGNGFECPVLLALGLDVADRAGETDVPRVVTSLCERPDRSLLEVVVTAGDVAKAAPPGLNETPGCILMTPAAIPPLTGTRTACGGFANV